jgi:hypothetical protein
MIMIIMMIITRIMIIMIIMMVAATQADSESESEPPLPTLSTVIPALRVSGRLVLTGPLRGVPRLPQPPPARRPRRRWGPPGPGPLGLAPGRPRPGLRVAAVSL